ncbi:O-demethylpuromycin-O-methyltransferase-like protein, partial [Leptotrombidium deliense]
MDKCNVVDNSETQSDQLVSVALDHISAYWRSSLINASIKLNIYEHLSKKSMSIVELADATQTHSPTLFRFMRALSTLNIFEMNEDHKWSTTPLAT